MFIKENISKLIVDLENYTQVTRHTTNVTKLLDVGNGDVICTIHITQTNFALLSEIVGGFLRKYIALRII